jgi:PAS domain S-box-containing protein
MDARYERDLGVYAELFEAAPDAYLVTDEQGTVIELNRRASSLFGCNVVGKPLATLIDAADGTALRAVLDARSDAIYRIDLSVGPRHDGRRQWLSLSAQRGRRDESSICIRWLIRDITPQKEEDALLLRREELLHNRIRELEASHAATRDELQREHTRRREAEERVRHQEQALAEVAHELRAPLGSIAGWLHVLNIGAAHDALKSRALPSMVRSVRALANLLDELLQHARIANHKTALNVGPLNLLRVVADVADDLRPVAELKGVQFELSAKHHQVRVNADQNRLHQVLRNVIGNAIKFTPEHGAVRIAVSLSHLHAEVSVSDTGRGIPREALSKIFVPFVQLGKDKRPTGLGLGLSIAKHLVELHGGSICAESDGAHRGTTFRIRLPLFAPN